MNLQPSTVYGCVLASWTDGLFVHPDVTFQGDNGGGFATIASDKYEVHSARGAIVKKPYDSTGTAVDWTSYTAGFRATYSLYNPATNTASTVTNEAQTVQEQDFGIAPFDPVTSQLNLSTAAANQFLAGDYLSLGTVGTRPKDKNTGTGIWGDATGLYGLASSVQQVVFSAATGKISAGSGSVLLDSTGITLSIGTTSGDSVKWTDTPGSEFRGLIYTNFDAITGSQLSIEAIGDAGVAEAAAVYINANSAGAGSVSMLMNVASGSKYVELANMRLDDILENARFDYDELSIRHAAPLRLYLNDTTASAKGFILTLASNKATIAEYGGAAPNLMVFDLANARVGVANASPSVAFDVTGAGLFSGALTTQGAFTSLGIDDNANAIAMTIDSTERVILTGTGTINHAGMNTILQGYSITTSAAAVAGASFGQFSADTRGSQINLSKSRNTSIALGTVVASGDTLGQILFTGDDGNTFDTGATIRAIVDGTPGDADMPTRLEFLTSADGSATPTLRMTLSSSSTLILADALNIVVNTSTGTKIGTGTTQKLGFWNATPIVQPTTSYGAASFTANAGTAVNDASTFDGYTLKQVVSALRGAGLLA